MSELSLLTNQHLLLAFLIIYIATIFLGNISAFTSLWIAFQGGLGSWGVPLVLLVIFCSTVSGDSLWYSLGRGLRATRFGNWIKNRIPNHDKLEMQIESKGRNWIVFGKFGYAMNFPVIFLTGWIKTKFQTFLKRSLRAVAIWLPIILGVSYTLYATLSPLAAAQDIKDFELIFLISLVLLMALQYIFTQTISPIFNKTKPIPEKNQET